MEQPQESDGAEPEAVAIEQVMTVELPAPVSADDASGHEYLRVGRDPVLLRAARSDGAAVFAGHGTWTTCESNWCTQRLARR